MRKRYVDVTGIDREEGERLAASIARKVLDVSEREPASIEAMSIPGVEEVAPESYDVLVQNTDLETEEGLEGSVAASEERVAAVFDLFSPPLLKAVVRDADGTAIFARHEYVAMEFLFDGDEYAELEKRLSEAEQSLVTLVEQ